MVAKFLTSHLIRIEVAKTYKDLTLIIFKTPLGFSSGGARNACADKMKEPRMSPPCVHAESRSSEHEGIGRCLRFMAQDMGVSDFSKKVPPGEDAAHVLQTLVLPA